MEKGQKFPEGGIKRDDGCVCPPPPPPKECKSKLPTCPYDPRFPNQNQTYHCYYSFIDYQRCARLLGDYPGCLIFYKCYTALCPRSWWERWFDQMEKGTFPRKIYPTKPIIRPDPAKMREMCYEDDPDTPLQSCPKICTRRIGEGCGGYDWRGGGGVTKVLMMSSMLVLEAHRLTLLIRWMQLLVKIYE